MSKYGVFSGPYFPVFKLNTKIHPVNLRIQSKYGKIQTRKNSAFGHISYSAIQKRFSATKYNKTLVNTEACSQKGIQNPVKLLTWSVLRK